MNTKGALICLHARHIIAVMYVQNIYTLVKEEQCFWRQE